MGDVRECPHIPEEVMCAFKEQLGSNGVRAPIYLAEAFMWGWYAGREELGKLCLVKCKEEDAP